MDSVIELPGISKSAYSPSIKEFGIALAFSEKESRKDKK
jgi:hypothetical protein